VASGAGKSGAGNRQSREAKERTRAYQAGQQFHDGLLARRRRDNVIAGVAGGVLILAVIGGQIAYYTLGPGTPAPAPSPSPTSSVTPTPEPSDDATPSPTDDATPSPTP